MLTPRLLPLALIVLLLALVPLVLLKAEPKGPVVLAAASLQEAMAAAADRWAAKGHPRPVISFAGSSALARQVEAGAPADMFVSADEEWMDHLAGKGLLMPGTRTSFLFNSIVLVAPRKSRAELQIREGFPLARALGPGRLAMADPDAVPAGRYGREALVRLGVWPSVAGRVAAADNVRVALSFVSRGEAPFGVVYVTDARAEPGVRVIGTFPANSHKPISYPLALLKRSANPEAARFRQFLLSAEGKAIFRRHGFGTR